MIIETKASPGVLETVKLVGVTAPSRVIRSEREPLAGLLPAEALNESATARTKSQLFSVATFYSMLTTSFGAAWCSSARPVMWRAGEKWGD